MDRLTHLELFAGIGGLCLAAEWAGFETVAVVEKNEFCRKVLAKNFPGAVIYDDVETFNPEPYIGRIAVLSGGFPCPGISVANPDGAGLRDERSGLWFRMLDIIRAVRPCFVVAENVPNLRQRGIDTVLSGLEAAGYSAGAFVVGAEDVGAPHKRQRVFVVAQASDPALFADAETDSTACAVRARREARHHALRGTRRDVPGTYWEVHEPPIPGVDDGIPDVMDRNQALGNAVSPWQAYPFFAAFAERLTAK